MEGTPKFQPKRRNLPFSGANVQKTVLSWGISSYLEHIFKISAHLATFWGKSQERVLNSYSLYDVWVQHI
ncbi:MAG: hypothetical protein AAF387_15525, partial [Pseudomonadota bacterium]